MLDVIIDVFCRSFELYFIILNSHTLSFSPSLSSGIPDKYTRILIAPTISERNTFPDAPITMVISKDLEASK